MLVHWCIQSKSMNQRLHVGSILSTEQNQIKKPKVTGLTIGPEAWVGLINMSLLRACFGGMKLAFSTSLTDATKEGIGALTLVLLRDAIIGAMTQACTLRQGSNGYYMDARRHVEPMPTTGLTDGTEIYAVGLQRLWGLLHSI